MKAFIDAGAGIRVLHLDDEEGLLYTTRELAQEFDHEQEWVSVNSPEEAFAKLDSGHFDVVVCDYQMPGADGIEICKRIKESEGPPCILYTGQGSEVVAEAAFKVGVDDYLRKEGTPSHVQVLTKRVRAAAEKHRAMDRSEHLFRVLKAIRNVNQLIVQESDRRKLIERACSLLIEAGAYIYASVILLDENKKISLFAHGGATGGIGERIAEQGIDAMACAEKAYHSSDIQINDSRSAICEKCPIWSGSPNTSGFAMRLENHGAVYGIMGATIPTRLIDEDEKVLFRELVGDIAFALYSIEANEERERNNEEIRKYEKILEAYIENSSDIVTIFDKNLNILFYNTESRRRTKAPNAWKGRSIYEMAPGIEKTGRPEAYKKVIETGIPVEYENIAGINAPGTYVTLKAIKVNEGVAVVAKDMSQQQRYRRSFSLLHAYAPELWKAKTENEVLACMFSYIDRVFEYPTIDIYRVNGGRAIQVLGKKGSTGTEVPVDSRTIIGRTLRTGESQLVEDTLKDPDFEGGAGASRSALTAPVFLQEKLYAVVNIESLDVGQFGEEDKDILGIFTDLMVIKMTQGAVSAGADQHG